MAMIEVQDLTKFFGRVLAVDHITFSMDRGEVVGLLGLNGAGKSTTMRMLTTFIPPTSGTARLAGFDIRTQSMVVRQNLGYLPENVPLYPEMRVEEYLQFRAKLKGMDRRTRIKRIEYCIDRCKILGVRTRLLGTLSRGYRQRVGLAEAMLHAPPVLILDEPTAGLDPKQQRETENLIKDLGTNHTILLSTHILPEVEEVCKRVIIINQGLVGLDRPLAELQGQSLLELEVLGPASELKQAVNETSKQLAEQRVLVGEQEASEFRLLTREPAELAATLKTILEERGWPIRRLDVRQQTLRDHFLRATGELSESLAG
jgi:ABC-2 type transport system ATP-binding protein